MKPGTKPNHLDAETKPIWGRGPWDCGSLIADSSDKPAVFLADKSD